MSLILNRKQVLNVYAEAAELKWVLPAFNSENLTTIKAILEATLAYGAKTGIENCPSL